MFGLDQSDYSIHGIHDVMHMLTLRQRNKHTPTCMAYWAYHCLIRSQCSIEFDKVTGTDQPNLTKISYRYNQPTREMVVWLSELYRRGGVRRG